MKTSVYSRSTLLQLKPAALRALRAAGLITDADWEYINNHRKAAKLERLEV